MKTLHVHIGTPKTGTTSIQNFCVDNEALLNRQGYCYPLFPYSYPQVAKIRNGHFLFGRLLDKDGKRDRQQEEAICQEGMQKLHKLFLKYDNIILSDEDIWRNMDDTKKTLWADLQKEAGQGGFGIHVIVYLRRQDKFFISNWNQNVKLRLGKFSVVSFDEFLERGNKKTRLEYYKKLERMAGVVGRENITVRRFDGGEFVGGSIYADFMQAIGLTLTEEYRISDGVRNSGLYGNTHEIKRILNGLPQMSDRSVNKFFTERLRECSQISSQSYPSEMMSKEEIRAFLDIYGPDNRRIAEEYLGEPGAELFDNTIKDLPKWQKENPYMQDDLIRFAGATAISLYQENQEMRQAIKDLTNFRFHIRHPFKTVLRRIKRGRGV